MLHPFLVSCGLFPSPDQGGLRFVWMWIMCESFPAVTQEEETLDHSLERKGLNKSIYNILRMDFVLHFGFPFLNSSILFSYLIYQLPDDVPLK